MTETEEKNRKRPHGNGSDFHQAKKSFRDKPALKLLVHNFIAGKLIGKGGSNLVEMKTKFDAHIAISPSNAYYPGTNERIVAVSADSEPLLQFMDYMIDEVQVDKYNHSAELDVKQTTNLDIKIVVSNLGAGLVIGKGGVTIKSINADTGAKVYLSSIEEATVENERVIVICGDNEQRRKASAAIIEKLVAEPGKASSADIRYGGGDRHYAGGSSRINGGYDGNMPSLYKGPSAEHNNLQPSPYAHLLKKKKQAISNDHMENSFSEDFHYRQQSRALTSFLVEMKIPEKFVGVILGKQGQTVKEICSHTRTVIIFSPKDEYAPNTSDRILTIRGDKLNNVQTAYRVVDQRLVQAEIKAAAGYPRLGPDNTY